MSYITIDLGDGDLYYTTTRELESKAAQQAAEAHIERFWADAAYQAEVRTEALELAESVYSDMVKEGSIDSDDTGDKGTQVTVFGLMVDILDGQGIEWTMADEIGFLVSLQ